MSSRWILRIRSHVIVRRPPIGPDPSFHPSRCRFPRGLSMWGSPKAEAEARLEGRPQRTALRHRSERRASLGALLRPDLVQSATWIDHS